VILVRAFEAPFMQRALLEVVVLGILAGIVGVVVLLRRLAFIADAVTHTAFPGVAVAFAIEASLYLGALVAAVGSAVLLTVATRHRRVDQDAVLALLVASFFAFGVVVVSRSRSFTADLTGLLFGRTLDVDRADIVRTVVIALVALALLGALRKEIVLRAFDPLATEALGYRVGLIDLVTNVVVALVVVAGVRAVGTALVIALIITPAAVARLVTRRLGPMVVVSAAVAAVCGWLGLVISWDASVHHDVRLPAGATIVVLLTAVFAVVASAKAIRRRWAERVPDGPGAPDGPLAPAVAEASA
jgi:manganese/iron transport system permease protein